MECPLRPFRGNRSSWRRRPPQWAVLWSSFGVVFETVVRSSQKSAGRSWTDPIWLSESPWNHLRVKNVMRHQPQNPQYANHEKSPSQVLQLAVIDATKGQHEFQIEGEYRQQIHQIQRFERVPEFIWRSEHAQAIFHLEQSEWFLYIFK